MNPVIKPESIDAMCCGMHHASDIHESKDFESQPKQSKWARIKYIIHDVCEAIRPVVDIIEPIFKTMAVFLTALTGYRQYSKNKRGESFAVC